MRRGLRALQFASHVFAHPRHVASHAVGQQKADGENQDHAQTRAHRTWIADEWHRELLRQDGPEVVRRDTVFKHPRQNERLRVQQHSMVGRALRQREH